VTGKVAVAFVVAVAENGVIGRGGQLPWKLPSDLKWFRKRTLNKPIIMGRKTYLSIGKPLDKRDTIVLTRRHDFRAPAGVHVVDTIDGALTLGRMLAADRGADEVMIIGGAEVFAAALPQADRIYLTLVHGSPAGDVWLPPFDAQVWDETERAAMHQTDADEFAADFIILDRKS
jgi:dihydrofolate reductase